LQLAIENLRSSLERKLMGVLTGETPHWIGLGKKATVLVFCITEYGI
jgi:hypothetical protein